MKIKKDEVATILVAILVVIVALVGGILVITHPETLTFKQYSDDLTKLAIGVGILGVGRGLRKAGRP